MKIGNLICFTVVSILGSLLLIGCDRSDNSQLADFKEVPKFDETTAAGKKAKQIYDTYGINCQLKFNKDDYVYEMLGINDETEFSVVDNLDKAVEFLSAFEDKALKILPKEIVTKAYANVYLCNEIKSKYFEVISKDTSNSTSSSNMTITTKIELLPIKIKTLGVAFGFAGSSWDDADLEYMQLRWIEYIFHTMLSNMPVPIEFNKAAYFNVSGVSEREGDTNYSLSDSWGWWCLRGGSGATYKKGGYQYDWGFLAPPYSGLLCIRYAMDGVTEIQIANSLENSTIYYKGYDSAMDFATYAAYILLKPKSYMDDLCSKYPLVATKVDLVKEYLLKYFNYELKSIAK